MNHNPISEILKFAVEQKASDIHIKTGSPVTLRVSGNLVDCDYEYEWRDAWEDENVRKLPRGVRIKVGELKKTVFIPTGVLGEEK